MDEKYFYERTQSGWYEICEITDEYYNGFNTANILGFVEHDDEARTIVDLLNEKDEKIANLTREVAKLLMVDALTSSNKDDDKEVIGKLKLKNSKEPSYYNSNGLSPLEAFKQGLLSEDELIGFCKGNVIKYIVRAGKKDDALKDIDKAINYSEHLKEILR